MTTRRVTYITGFPAITFADPLGWALVDEFFPNDEANDFFMDAVAGFEFVDASYVRQVATGFANVVTPPAAEGGAGFLGLVWDDPDFGVMSDGNTASGLVLFVDMGLDSVSPILAVYPCSYTADSGPSVFFVSPSGAVVISTVCPAEFNTWGS